MRWVALIRGIGPTTHAKMSMADLRAGCESAGFSDVRTLLATGNVAFETADGEEAILRAVSGVLARHGLDNAVALRRVEDLAEILAANPFPEAASDRPNHLLVHYLPRPAPDTDPAWDGPERIAARGREAFIDYAEGVGRSKLTINVLDRLLGPGGTARNWNTSRKLCDA